MRRNHKPTGDFLATNLIILSAGELIQDPDAWHRVYRHQAWLPYPLEADTEYAIVTMQLTGHIQWWLRFRSTGWEGEKDEGWQNHTTLFITYDGGANWIEAYPYFQCYEVWGSQ